MKLTYKIGALMALMMLPSSAALYTVTTGSGATATGFANSAGLAFQSNSTNGLPAGGISVGIFSTEDFTGVSSSAQLLSLFTAYSSGGTFTLAGPFGNKGFFSLAGNGVITNSQFAGKNMFVLVGNNTNLSLANEFAVVKLSNTFTASDDAVSTPITVSFTTSNSTLLWGNTIADLKTTATDSSVTPGFQTAVLVPEPSAVLLSVLGALGLLRRRRA
ncbi:MAG: PEP-CTERM sorting domain-containing protein [Luteolibacter sp.]